MKDRLARVLLVAVIVWNVATAIIERKDEMQFSELIQKMASGQQLTEVEQQELVLEARRMEELSDLFASLIQPGTKILVVDGLIATNAKIDSAQAGDVTLDGGGLFIPNSTEAWFSFGDSNNTRGLISLSADPFNDFEVVNLASGGTISAFLKTTNEAVNRVLHLSEDDQQTGRVRLDLENADNNGTRMTLTGNTGAADEALIDFRTQGVSGGSTFIRMRETANTPPGGENDAFHLYMKGDKLIVQFDELGTPHYFYLNLAATTNQSWIYSATAP